MSVTTFAAPVATARAFALVVDVHESDLAAVVAVVPLTASLSVVPGGDDPRFTHRVVVWGTDLLPVLYRVVEVPVQMAWSTIA